MWRSLNMIILFEWNQENVGLFYNIMIKNIMDYKTQIIHESPTKSFQEEDSILMSNQSSGKHTRNIDSASLMQVYRHSRYKHNDKLPYTEQPSALTKNLVNDNQKEQDDTHDSYIIQTKPQQLEAKQKQDNMVQTYHSCKKSNMSHTSSQQSLLLDSESSTKHQNHQIVQKYLMMGNKIYDEHQSVLHDQSHRRLSRTSDHKHDDDTKISFDLTPSYYSQQPRQSLDYSYSISIDQSIKLIKSFPSSYQQDNHQHNNQYKYHNHNEQTPIVSNFEFSGVGYSNKIFPIKQLIQQLEQDYYEQGLRRGLNSYGALWLDKAVLNKNMHMYTEKDMMKHPYNNENEEIGVVRNVKSDYHRWDRQDQHDTDHHSFNVLLMGEDNNISAQSPNQDIQVGIRKLIPKLSQSIEPIQNSEHTYHHMQPTISVQQGTTTIPEMGTKQPNNPLHRMRTSFVKNRNEPTSKDSDKNITYVSMMDPNVVKSQQNKAEINNNKVKDQRSAYLSTIYNIRTENSEDDGQPYISNSGNIAMDNNNSGALIIEKEGHEVQSIEMSQQNNSSIVNDTHQQSHSKDKTIQNTTYTNQTYPSNNTNINYNQLGNNSPAYYINPSSQSQFVAPTLTHSYYHVQETYRAVPRSNSPIDCNTVHNNNIYNNRPAYHPVINNKSGLTNTNAGELPKKQKTMGKKIKFKVLTNSNNNNNQASISDISKTRPTFSKNPSTIAQQPKPSQLNSNPTNSKQLASRRCTSIGDWCCDSESEGIHVPRNSISSSRNQRVRSRNGRFLSLSKDQGRIDQ